MNRTRILKTLLLGFAIFCIIYAAVVLFLPSEAKPTSEMDYYAYAASLDYAEIINTEDLTTEMLESRNGKLIIERVVGVVDDATNGDGHVINDGHANNNELSYIRYEKGIAKGTVICTYFVYNPDTNYLDDILLRYDYIMDASEMNK